MSSDHETEIRASVAAHADLGPGYDDAVAQAGYQAPAGYPGYQAPAGYPGYKAPAGYQGYLGPALPPGYQLGPPPARPSPVGQRSVATTVTALGSMALGVGATAIVSGERSSAA